MFYLQILDLTFCLWHSKRKLMKIFSKFLIVVNYLIKITKSIKIISIDIRSHRSEKFFEKLQQWILKFVDLSYKFWYGVLEMKWLIQRGRLSSLIYRIPIDMLEKYLNLLGLFTELRTPPPRLSGIRTYDVSSLCSFINFQKMDKNILLMDINISYMLYWHFIKVLMIHKIGNIFMSLFLFYLLKY